jgi:hypothetical protein
MAGGWSMKRVGWIASALLAALLVIVVALSRQSGAGSLQQEVSERLYLPFLRGQAPTSARASNRR